MLSVELADSCKLSVPPRDRPHSNSIHRSTSATQMAKSKNGGGRGEDGTNSYWRQLTDEQLLEISFTTDDPEKLDGLVMEVPTGDTSPIVELAYDFRGSKRPYIRCAHCKYPNHLAGVVVKVQDGRRFLCGHDCGEKIYGVQFEALQKDFTHAKDRAGYLRRLRNLKQALPAFLEWLARLRAEPAFAQYSQTRQRFFSAMPRLKGTLQIAVERQNTVRYLGIEVDGARDV